MFIMIARKSQLTLAFALCTTSLLLAQSTSFSSYQAALDWAKSATQTLAAALPIFDANIVKAKQEGKLDTAALFIHYKAVKYYKENIDSALAINAQAIQIRMEIKDINGASLSHYNQALFYNTKGDTKAATASFEQVLNLGFRPENAMFVSASYRLSRGERDKGDYERALYYLDLAYQPLQQSNLSHPKDSANLAMLDHAFATIYNQMADSLLAIKAKEHLLNELKLYTAIGASEKLPAAYFELGNAYENLHQYDSAIVFFQKASEGYVLLEDDQMVNDANNNLSIPHRKLGNYKKAIRLLTDGLTRHESRLGKAPHPAKARLHDNLGEVFLAQGDLDQAMQHFQWAIANLSPINQETDFLENPSLEALENNNEKEDLLTYLGDKARCWQAFYQLKKEPAYLKHALDALKLADYLVDLMRAEHLDRESKLFWRQRVHQIYEEGLAICYLLKDPIQAYYFLEKSRAVLLLDALVEADTRGLIDPGIAEQENQINQALISLRAQLKESPASPTIPKEILDQQKALQTIKETLQEKYPEYYDLRFKTTLVALDTFRLLLTKDQAAIQFFYGKNHIYLLCIEKEGTQLTRIPRSNAMDQQIWAYLSFFQQSGAILNQPQLFQTTAQQLYQSLLAATLANITAKRLLLMVDGVLHNLPFEALLLDNPGNKPLGQWPYLHVAYPLNYAYSATIYAKQTKMAKSSPSGRRPILAMAPFAADNTPNAQTLTYSRDELKRIATCLRGQYLYGKGASSQLFMAEAANYSILHLSTHAAVNDKEGEPYIDFGDAKIYLPYLYGLSLSSDLVVLSACQTSLGELKRGEGVMSLTRGFTYAGARSLISSLWKVNDRATAQIFASFYQQLSTGKTKAEALHLAKSAYLQDKAIPDEEKSPYYWAGFIHYGDDSALDLPWGASSFPWRWGLMAFLVCSLAFTLVKFKSK